MTSKTRIYAGIICLLVALVCILGLASCGKCTHEWGEWTAKTAATCTEDGIEEHACTKCGETETRPLAATGHKGGAATCTSDAICLECDTKYAEALGHDWQALPGGNKAATCTENGYCEYGCSRCKESKTETFTAKGHSYTETVVAPTCTESGYTAHTCSVCGGSYNDTVTPATGHSFGDTADCIDGRTCSACGESEGGGTGHIYVPKVTAPTCTEGGYTTHTCVKCSDSYTDSETPAKGHTNKSGETTEREVDGETCKVELVYACDDCGETVVENTVYYHKYKATVTTAATCSADGVKTLTCSECADSLTEPIKKNDSAHVWVAQSTSGAKRTDVCTVCSATKSVTVVEGNATPSTNANDLKDTEIEMNDASLSLDDGVIDKVAGKDVVITADKLTGADRPTAGLDENKLAQIGDSPVFNFTMSDGDGFVEKFGDDNWVTITVPYDETMGDVDNIAIWFIAANGELETIPAVYNNGYVTFKTNHFSYYTVTRLNPKERCAVYGHNYVYSTVAPTCTEGGYTFTVCIRCAESFKSDELPALGHSYVTETTAATCTKGGVSTSICSTCSHTYFTMIPATGHTWGAVETKPATCAAPGFEKYSCEGCGASNTRTYPQLPHSMHMTTVAPTCTEGGYDLYVCAGCDYSYTKNEKPAIGHSLSPAFSWLDDFSGATLTLTCTNDPSHVFTVQAGITKKSIDDKEFDKVEHTATAVYNGETYTDVKIEVLGDHTHDYSAKTGYNEDYHWLECVCGDKKNVTEHTWAGGDITLAPTCANDGVREITCPCGAKSTAPVPATGEHDYKDGFCTVCGSEKQDSFYLNLFSSATSFETLSIEISDLTYSFNTRSVTDSVMGSIMILDGIKIEVSLKDGELYVAAEGAVDIFNGPERNKTVTCAFDVLIEDGIIYGIIDTYSKEKSYGKESILMPLEFALSGGDVNTVKGLLGIIPDALQAVDRFAEVVISEKSEDINAFLEKTFNIIFTTEMTDKSCTVTLDGDKLKAFIDNLKTMKVSELIDHYYGEGSTEALKELALEIGAMKLSELPKYLTDNLGVSEDLLFETADSLSVLFGAPDNVSIRKLIEDNGEAKISDIGDRNPFAPQAIEETYKLLCENSLFAFLPFDAELVSTATDALKPIIDNLTFKLATDKDGNLLNAYASLAEMSVKDSEGYETIIGYAATVNMNGKLTLDMSELKRETEKLLVDCPDVEIGDIYDETDVIYDDYFTYGTEEYEIVRGMEVSLKKINSTVASGVIVTDDCEGWKHYDACLKVDAEVFHFLYLRKPDSDKEITNIVVVRLATDEIAELNMGQDGVTVVMVSTGEIKKYSAEQMNDMVFFFTDVFGLVDAPWSDTDYIYGEFYYDTVNGEHGSQTHHNYTSTYVVTGNDCTNGRISTTTCQNCGDSYTSEERSHVYKDSGDIINVGEAGICGGSIEYHKCSACDAYSYVDVDLDNCSFSTRLEGDTLVSTCESCGVVYTKRVSYGERDENCHRTEYTHYSITLNGSTVFSGYTSYRTEAHDYEVRYEMNGTVCEDGVTEYSTCLICGYTEKYTYDYHKIIRPDILGDAITCPDHYCGIGACLCGAEYSRGYFDGFEYADTDYGTLHYCDACGIKIYLTESYTDSDCIRTENIDIVTVSGDKTVYSGSISYKYEHHDLKMKIRKTANGSVITRYCEGCGESTTFDQFTAKLEKHGEEYYYDLYVTPDKDMKYSITSFNNNDTKVTLYRLDGDMLIELETDDDSGAGNNFYLSSYLEAGYTYVYRLHHWQSSYSYDISYAFLNADMDGNCDHNTGRIVDGVIFDGGNDCTDGAAYYILCPECMQILELSITYEHTAFFELDTIDLTDSGCEGYIEREVCVCGKNDVHTLYNICYDTVTRNRYYDGNGNLVYVKTLVCNSCSRRYEESHYTVYNAKNCTATSYYTVVISNGNGYSRTLSYTTVDPYHSYRYDYDFDGESGSCYDGVTVNMTCTVCGKGESEHYTHHEEHLKERIDLKSLGCVCGGYVDVYVCPCGAESYVDFDNMLCDMDIREIDPWTNDYLSGWHYHTGGRDYYDYVFEEHKCSVTDPIDRACTFTIRYASYWHRDPATCTSSQKIELLIGYNEATGRSAYTYVHDTGALRQAHKYDGRDYNYDEDGISGYKGACVDCRGIYENYNYQSGNTTVYVTSMTNRRNNGFNRSRYTEERYIFFNNTSQCVYEYFETVDADGKKTWERSEIELESITAPFGTNAFRRTSASYYSDGTSRSTVEEITYYKGYSYQLLRHETYSDGRWEKSVFEYSFVGGCSCTETRTYSDSEPYVETYSVHRTHSGTIKLPTCSQPGIGGESCYVCNMSTGTYPISPTRHSWIKVGDKYVCYYCMLENSNGATGDITLEDLTGLLGGGTDYVVGYYAETGVSFIYNVSLILKNPVGGNDQIILSGISFREHSTYTAIVFSKSEVAAAASALGYSPDEYYVRFAFVPIGGDGSLDYAITLTENYPPMPDVVTKLGTYTAWIGYDGYVEFTVMCDGNTYYHFISHSYADTYVEIYKNGEKIVSDDDGGDGANFHACYYSAEAGQITVRVKFLSDYAGCFPVEIVKE